MQARPDVEADAPIGEEADEADVLRVVVALAGDEEAGGPELTRCDRDVGAVEHDLRNAGHGGVDAVVLEELPVGVEEHAARLPRRRDAQIRARTVVVPRDAGALLLAAPLHLRLDGFRHGSLGAAKDAEALGVGRARGIGAGARRVQVDVGERVVERLRIGCRPVGEDPIRGSSRLDGGRGAEARARLAAREVAVERTVEGRRADVVPELREDGAPGRTVASEALAVVTELDGVAAFGKERAREGQLRRRLEAIDDREDEEPDQS